ncbi:cbb3-type cytochrome c oxidase subunit I [Nibricoccus sp. IMCC34717]|uniref:cbb3-type cytochrome c oxidase subunit I n=1 Tax=Nibricoccus sp. IMCC34717 TaxID=3034021 RepID=UPI00384B0A93
MASQPSLAASFNPATNAEQVKRAELSEIDASSKTPVLFFLGSAVLWLIAGTVFALISSFKMHTPNFLGDVEWLTFGRARTAHLNLVIYGWSANAAFAVAIWLMARLSRAVVQHPLVLMLAGAFWNLGVTIGVIGILMGDATSIEWLEIPPYATPMLFAGYALIGAWGIITFRFGKSQHIYVSQWYLLAALFWFPWLYSVAQIMLIFVPARGTVQALVNWWFAHNVLGLWFTPIGLAAVYYFLPKVLGKPIHSYYLSVLGFWSLALFYNWAGVHHLIGGPVPAWVQTAGIAASFMMVIPVVVTAINHHLTMIGSFSALKYSPTLRFIVFGAVSYTLASLIGSAMADRNVAEVTHFTQFTVGHAHHGMYAFFTMVMFGSIYYMMPRIVLREWPSARLISWHFWFTAIGITIMVLALSIGGVDQGINLNTADAKGNIVGFMEVIRLLKTYLLTRSLSGILITIGHLAFAVNFVWMLSRPKAAADTAPTLLANPPQMEVSR